MLNTIVSLITPPLKGAVALIRLSGDISKEIIDNIFTKKIEKPKIIFYKSIDRGDGIKADALPGSVYWTSQKGASKAMEQKQIDDIKAQKADFIITEESDSISLNKRISALESYGYKVAYRFTAKDKWYLVRVLLTNHSE